MMTQAVEMYTKTRVMNYKPDSIVLSYCNAHGAWHRKKIEPDIMGTCLNPVESYIYIGVIINQ